MLMCVLAVCVPSLAAQDRVQKADSTATDTLIVRMMDGIGDSSPGQPAEVLADSQWYWSDARTVPEAFAMLPGIYQYDQGGEGKPVGTWFLGSENEIALIDGTPIGTELFSVNALSAFPLEFIQGVEELRGPSALLAGARWNLRSHQYASARPRTAVRFVQSPNETIFSDGYYTQNVARSTNLHFGFQRRTSNGRFDNSGLDSWSLRGRLRYNAAPWLNLMGTWTHEKTSNGMNGGIDRARTTTIFDEVSAIVIEPDAYELRTNTSLSFHALADLLGDSLSLTRLTVSTTDEEREFHRIAPTSYQPVTRDFAISDRSVIRLEQAWRLPWFTLRGMLQTSGVSSTDSSILRGSSRSAKAAGAALEVRLTPFITPSVGIRVDNAPEGSRTSFAGSLGLHFSDDVSLSASVEQRARFPGLRETAWNDSLVLHPGNRTIGGDILTAIGAKWEFMASSFIQVEGYHRKQTDKTFYVQDSTAFGTPAISERAYDGTIAGVRMAGQVTFGPLYLAGWLTTMTVDGPAVMNDMHPRIWARWEGGWKDRLFGDELGLQVTLRGTFFDRHKGFVFDPSTGLQVLQSSVLTGRMTRLDGFIVMDIGSAFVTLAWENIVSTNYFKLVTHPMPERTFRLGVRWNFLD